MSSTPGRNRSRAAAFAPPAAPQQGPDQRRVELVAGAVGGDVADEVLAQEGEVADHVEDLVPGALVGVAEVVVDRAVGPKISRSAAVVRDPIPACRRASASAARRNVRLSATSSRKVSGARSRKRLWAEIGECRP